MINRSQLAVLIPITILVDEGKGRARHRFPDAQSAAKSLDKGRFAGTYLPGEGQNSSMAEDFQQLMHAPIKVTQAWDLYFQWVGFYSKKA